MLKAIARNPLLSHLNRSCFSTTEGRDKRSLVILDKGERFFRNVYGIEMKKHIMPFYSYRIPWRLEQMQDIRKKIPTYLVVLVRKVLEEAEELGQIRQQQNQSKDGAAIDKFYNVATYCKISYSKQYVEIEGLHRVTLKSCELVPPETNLQQENSQAKVVQTDDAYQEMEEGQIDGMIDASTDESSKALVFKSPLRKLNLPLYSLQVDKLDEPYFKFDHQMQIKLKFLIQTYKMLLPTYKHTEKFQLFNPNQALRNIYMIAQQMSNDNYKIKEIQQILEQNDPEEKMYMILEIMKKTLDWKSVYRTIEDIATSNLRNKKFYQYYSQILKIAKQNIQGKKGKQLFLEKITKKFNEQKPPAHIKQIFEQERAKFVQMDQNAVEASVVKKYLQDLSLIPYSIKTEEVYDLEFAEKALDQDHYGMKEVKDAILQIIAVGKLKGTLKGKIFCLVGGPGVGKTTIAKSISKALGRKFFNISLGGVTDSSVLKGHRRTYIGAYSGKIIEALKECEANNPVILLDEIDKMGSSFQGDPRSELLEILDPNQNESFLDNFIDVPIDLSNVLFICSANYQRNISKPLLDRMEKIKLHSYTDDEKKEIFKRHLIKRAIEKTGVKEDQFILQADILDSLIYDYSEGEPGVRRLEKNIIQILEKIAYKIVQGKEELPISVTASNLKDYLGNGYLRKRDHNNLHVGVAISLGGGDYDSRLTYIESFRKSFASRKNLQRGVMFTGSLGNVFKETMNISYTFARNFLKKQLNNTFLFQNQVHIHALDGAAKKDGSMDSLTICTTLVSLALQQKVRSSFAMTGEMTLHGKILRTHGTKQKILLARRERISNLIVPLDNKPDVEMLTQEVKRDLNIHYVSQFRQVFSLLFEKEKPSEIKPLQKEEPIASEPSVAI